MYKDLAWNHFMKTYMEYRKIQALNNKEGIIIDETYQSKGDSNKRSSV